MPVDPIARLPPSQGIVRTPWPALSPLPAGPFALCRPVGGADGSRLRCSWQDSAASTIAPWPEGAVLGFVMHGYVIPLPRRGLTGLSARTTIATPIFAMPTFVR